MEKIINLKNFKIIIKIKKLPCWLLFHLETWFVIFLYKKKKEQIQEKKQCFKYFHQIMFLAKFFFCEKNMHINIKSIIEYY